MCLKTRRRIISVGNAKEISMMRFAFKLSIICSLLVLVVAQLDSVFEFYELSPNGNLRPIANPSTTPRYQNNFFINNQREDQNDLKYDGIMIVMEQSSCDSFWSIKNDYMTGTYGQLALPSTDNSKAILRVVLSIAVRLPSVSKIATFT